MDRNISKKNLGKMPLHFTVNGVIENPLINKKKKSILASDVEQIKKYERARRRRLRIEQVRQQSRDISSKLLERTKNIAKQEVEKLMNKHGNLMREHNSQICNVKNKYLDEMEQIGLAHESASKQVDSEILVEAEKYKQQQVAAERGNEAAKRISEAKKLDPVLLQQKRLKQVRQVEDLRSSMIANLKNRPELLNKSKNKTEINDESKNKINRGITLKTKPKKLMKKASVKVLSKPVSARIRNSQRSFHSVDSKLMRKHAKTDVVHLKNMKNVNLKDKRAAEDVIEYIINKKKEDLRDVNEIIVENPIGARKSSETQLSYDPSDYILDDNTSDGSTVESNGNNLEDYCIGNDQKCDPDVCNAKVELYDLNTRHRTNYEQPKGLVERLDLKDTPNAQELAEKVSKSENLADKSSEQLQQQQRFASHRRGTDAALREKVKKDYEQLLKHLDFLSKEERKLKATSMYKTEFDQFKKAEHHSMRQREMEHCIDSSIGRFDDDSIKIVSKPTPLVIASRKQSSIDNKKESTDKRLTPNREEQILEMLKKVEHQKRLLLMEFGATLPEDVFSASVSQLFKQRELERESQLKQSEQQQQQQQQKVTCATCPGTNKTKSPEIKVINTSKQQQSSAQSSQPSIQSGDQQQKSKKKRKKKKKSRSNLQTVNEIAVQTSNIEAEEEVADAEDKSIQVELITPEIDLSKSKKLSTTRRKDNYDEIHYLEPMVTIITHPNDRISTTSADSRVLRSEPSNSRGLIINVGPGQVQVTPKKHSPIEKQSKKKQTRSLPPSGSVSPIKASSTSAPASRAHTPQEQIIGSEYFNRSSSEGGNERETSPKSSENDRISVVDEDEDEDDDDDDDDENGLTTPKMISKKIQTSSTSTRDTSGTSTTYQSLPKRSNFRRESSQNSINTSILQLLNNPTNLSNFYNQVSPVSTPKTPSPRTMNIPSNLLHPNRISRILNYQEKDNDNGKFISGKSKRINQSTSTDKGKNNNNNNNNNNKIQMLDHLESTKNYKYLQEKCAKKISSLSALLEKVRGEKRIFDYSVLASSDDTILMDLPESVGRNLRSKQHPVDQVIQQIEDIDDKLKNTMRESEKSVQLDEQDKHKLTSESFKSLDSNFSDIINPLLPSISQATSLKDTFDSTKQSAINSSKPRIISIESANINLSKFNLRTGAKKTCKDIQLVQKLSNEILEQSKFQFNQKVSTGDRETTSISSKNPKFSTKISDMVDGAASGSAPKPDGQTRPELSTIEEIETPDTGNRSKTSIPSRSNRKKHSSALQKNVLNQQQLQHQQLQQQTNFINSDITPGNYLTVDRFSTGRKSVQDSGIDSTSRGLKIPSSQNYYPSQSNSNNNNIHTKFTEMKTSASSRSLSEVSIISEFFNLPSSESSDKSVHHSSDNDKMDKCLANLGLSWLIPVAKKTREASALSSSSNSDYQVVAFMKERKSPTKKNKHYILSNQLPDFLDLSSISIEEANKSTEKTVLMKARTSTPNVPHFYYSERKSTSTTTSISTGTSFHERSEPNFTTNANHSVHLEI